MSTNNLGYLSITILMLILYLYLRKTLKLPSIGNRKQLFTLFLLTYTTSLLWDNFAVSSNHWHYKNMIGIYLGYSPIENILLALVYPIAIITVYQIVTKLATKRK